MVETIRHRMLLIRLTEDQYKYLHDESFNQRLNKTEIIRKLIDAKRGV